MTLHTRCQCLAKVLEQDSGKLISAQGREQVAGKSVGFLDFTPSLRMCPPHLECCLGSSVPLPRGSAPGGCMEGPRAPLLMQSHFSLGRWPWPVPQWAPVSCPQCLRAGTPAEWAATHICSLSPFLSGGPGEVILTSQGPSCLSYKMGINGLSNYMPQCKIKWDNIARESGICKPFNNEII